MNNSKIIFTEKGLEFQKYSQKEQKEGLNAKNIKLQLIQQNSKNPFYEKQNDNYSINKFSPNENENANNFDDASFFDQQKSIREFILNSKDLSKNIYLPSLSKNDQSEYIKKKIKQLTQQMSRDYKSKRPTFNENPNSHRQTLYKSQQRNLELKQQDKFINLVHYYPHSQKQINNTQITNRLKQKFQNSRILNQSIQEKQNDLYCNNVRRNQELIQRLAGRYKNSQLDNLNLSKVLEEKKKKLSFPDESLLENKDFDLNNLNNQYKDVIEERIIKHSNREFRKQYLLYQIQKIKYKKLWQNYPIPKGQYGTLTSSKVFQNIYY